MNILIHAGIHRTGTTSLQEFLADNRAPLMARGISYPGDTRNHQSLAWSLKRGAGREEIRSLIESQDGAETVVLSAEDFCIHTDLRWLEEISQIYQTQVVFYLRRQDHWLMSWYNQHIKWPFDRSKSQMGKNQFLEVIGDFHWLDYAVLLDRWTSVLGTRNVSAGVVEQGQVGNVIEDFVDRLGIPHAGLDFEDKRRNDSLPVHLLEIARHLGLFDLPPNSRTRMLRALRAGLAHKEQSAKTIYSPGERQRVIDRFAASNQAVAKRMFKRGSLFFEPPPPPDAPYFSFPDVSQQEFMRDWIAPVMRALLPPP